MVVTALAAGEAFFAEVAASSRTDFRDADTALLATPCGFSAW